MKDSIKKLTFAKTSLQQNLILVENHLKQELIRGFSF